MELIIDSHYIEDGQFHIFYTLEGNANQSYDRKRISRQNTDVINNELIDFYIDTYEPKNESIKFVMTKYLTEEEPIFKFHTCYFVKY